MVDKLDTGIIGDWIEPMSLSISQASSSPNCFNLSIVVLIVRFFSSKVGGHKHPSSMLKEHLMTSPKDHRHRNGGAVRIAD
jgi:hypothetical protein